MHELSLAQGLMGELERLAQMHGAKRVLDVYVGIGSMSGIVVDSFVFGFNAIKTDLELTKDAVLHIDTMDGADLVLNRVEME